MEVESRVNGTVHTLHGQRLVGSQRIQVGKVRLWIEGGWEGEQGEKQEVLLERQRNRNFEPSRLAPGTCRIDGAGGGTCEDDGVEAGFAPQLHEVDHVAKAQGRVAGENDARLAEVTAEVAVDAGVVLQLVGLDQLTSETTTTRS